MGCAAFCPSNLKRALSWVVRLFAVALLLVATLPTLAQAQSDAPAVLQRATQDDVRVVQAALTLTLDYNGLLDGDWGPRSQRALESYIARTRPSGVGFAAYMTPLLAGFQREWQAAEWEVLNLDTLGVSVAQPLGLLSLDPEDERYLTLRSRPEGLLVRWMQEGWAQTAAMHDWARRAHLGRNVPYQVLGNSRMISAVEMAGREKLYLRSELIGGRFVTLLIQAEPPQWHRQALIAASFRLGPQPPLAATPGGALDWLGARTPPPPSAQPPDTARVARPSPDLKPESGDMVLGSGTGFFVNDTALVTAAHVIEGCTRLTLDDGTVLVPVAEDGTLDLAVLRAARRSESWLMLQADATPRLGQTVAAVGYPFYQLSGGALTLTTGNISAIPDPDVAAQRIMISAPVQPGNSGGPLLSETGQVVGVVVARASDAFFLKETGTLPQDMNWAVRLAGLKSVLSQADIRLPTTGPGPQPISQGLADSMQRAIRPILCHG